MASPVLDTDDLSTNITCLGLPLFVCVAVALRVELCFTIDDPTSTTAGVRPISEVRPDVVNGTVFPIEALPAGANTAVPEETVECALVFAARELQEVVWWYVVVLVDGLDDTRERVA